MELRVIARIESPVREKFGLPRQAGLVETLPGLVVFEPDFRREDALRGLEGFSHLWLIWGFSQVRREAGGQWSPTVRPPRLGGNARLGVFATRSPNRPNPLGLSAVRLIRIDRQDQRGPVLHIQGADLMDGTPIYDIKPYLPYADAIAEATGGFASAAPEAGLTVSLPAHLGARLPEGDRVVIQELLAADPRPAYQQDGGRVYGMAYGRWNIRFRVEAGTALVVDIQEGE